MTDQYKTLGDISRFIAEQHLKVEDSAVAQYVKSAVEIVHSRGENLEDYALIRVSGPMQLKDDTTWRVDSQYRLVRVGDLENVPTFDD